MKKSLTFIFCLQAMAASAQELTLPALPDGADGTYDQQIQTAIEALESASNQQSFSELPYNSIIVEYANPLGFNSAPSMAAAAQMGATAVELHPQRFELEISRFAVSPDPSDLTPGVIDFSARLEALQSSADSDPNVLRWYPNYEVTSQNNEPMLGLQWHYGVRGDYSDGNSPGGSNIVEAWKSGIGSHDVVVAVLDTGILPDHEDMDADNLILGYDFVSSIEAAADGDGWDPDPTDPGDACGDEGVSSWHGTHVAGTIGAVDSQNEVGIAGVAGDVSIIPVRVLGKCGGSTSDIITAVRWAADVIPDEELARLGIPPVSVKADIINLSLGGRGVCVDGLAEVYQEVLASGTFVIAAAGNSADDARLYSPAGCPAVFTVAASGIDGRLAARYSNYGPSVNIMGPGGDIQTDHNNDGYADGVLSTIQGGYNFYNGTSMAAPHVAGVAALIMSREEGISPQRVAAYLLGYSHNVSEEACAYRKCGSGLLDAQFLAPN